MTRNAQDPQIQEPAEIRADGECPAPDFHNLVDHNRSPAYRTNHRQQSSVGQRFFPHNHSPYRYSAAHQKPEANVHYGPIRAGHTRSRSGVTGALAAAVALVHRQECPVRGQPERAGVRMVVPRRVEFHCRSSADGGWAMDSDHEAVGNGSEGAHHSTLPSLMQLAIELATMCLRAILTGPSEDIRTVQNAPETTPATAGARAAPRRGSIISAPTDAVRRRSLREGALATLRYRPVSLGLQAGPAARR